MDDSGCADGREILQLCFFAAARFSRSCAAQPSLFNWRPRAIASESAGTSSVTQDAAATYEPLPSLIGATRVESLPTKTPSSMVVMELLMTVYERILQSCPILVVPRS